LLARAAVFELRRRAFGNQLKKKNTAIRERERMRERARERAATSARDTYVV